MYTPKLGNFCVKKVRRRGTKRGSRRFEVPCLLCHFLGSMKLCFQPRPFKRKWKLRPVVLMPFLHDLQKLAYEKGETVMQNTSIMQCGRVLLRVLISHIRQFSQGVSDR